MSLGNLFSSLFKPAPRATPSDYTARIRSGEALLVDVREPNEWSRGVAQSAALLPLSDLRGPRKLWQEFLANAGQRELLIYCASGMRSSTAARILQEQGVRALNAGGLGDWASAGWPIVKPNATPR